MAKLCGSYAKKNKKNGEVVAAVTRDPVKDELFWAEKGKGAFVNNRRLRVSARRQVQDSMLAINFDISDFVNTRQTGSSALDLAYVAAGRFDGYAQKRFGAWDVSGGCLMVREAGGVVTDFSGAKFNHTEVKGIAAGSSFIQPEIVKRLI